MLGFKPSVLVTAILLTITIVLLKAPTKSVNQRSQSFQPNPVAWELPQTIGEAIAALPK